MGKRLGPIKEMPEELMKRETRCVVTSWYKPFVCVGIEFHDSKIAYLMETPEHVDEVIQALLRHKRNTWPESH